VLGSSVSQSLGEPVEDGSEAPQQRDGGEVERLPQSWTGLKAAVALAIVLVVGLTFSSASFFPALIYAGIWASAALGLSLLVGWAGQISLGQAAVVAIGAYGAALASAKLGLPFLLAAPIGLAAAVLVAILTSPILRIRGFYFVLATLAFGTVIAQLLVALEPLTGGANGLLGMGQLTIFGMTAEEPQTFYFIGWGLAVVGAVLLERMVSGRYGRALKIVKTSPDVAAGMGIPVARVKAVAWLVSALFSGLAGVIFAYYSGYITPDQFSLYQSVNVLAAVMLAVGGGIWWTLVGVVVVLAGPQLLHLSSDTTQLATPLVLIAVAAVSGLGPRSPLVRGWRRARTEVRRAARSTLPVRRSPEHEPVPRAPQHGDGASPANVAAGARPVRPGATDAPALELTDVRKSFGGLKVLRGVDFRVEQGTIQGLIGPNGAGKSSMLNCVMGALPLDRGSVELLGAPIVGRSTEWIAQHGLVRTFQHPHLVDDEPVITNVMMGAHLTGSVGPLGAAFTRRARGEEKDIRRRAVRALEHLGCANLARVRAAELTAGQKRLVATAQALAASPRVLMLDEPAAGLNDAEMAELVASLLALRAQGMTIVVIEHHLDFVARACDRVAALVEGHIVTNAPPTETMRHPEVIRAYLGTAV